MPCQFSLSFGQAAPARKDLKQKMLTEAEQRPPEATLHSSERRELCPKYIETVLNYLRRNESNLNAEQRKEVVEQKNALERLKSVMESRLLSKSTELVFDANLDDDETILMIMHALDTNDNGAISETELICDCGRRTALMKLQT